MVYKYFDKKFAGSGVATLAYKSAFNNEQLAEEFHKPITRNFKERTDYSRFKRNIWGADLANMQLISKFNKGLLSLIFLVNNTLGLFL